MLSKKTKKLKQYGGLIPRSGMMASILTGAEPSKCTFKRKMTGLSDSIYNKSTLTDILKKATFLRADGPDFKKFFKDALTLKCASKETHTNAKMCITMLQCLENKDYDPNYAAKVKRMTELPKERGMYGGSVKKTREEKKRDEIAGKYEGLLEQLHPQMRGSVSFSTDLGIKAERQQRLLNFNSRMWRNLLYAAHDLISISDKKEREEGYKVFIYFFCNILFPVLIEYCNRTGKVPNMFKELSKEFSELFADIKSREPEDNKKGFLYERYKDPITNTERYKIREIKVDDLTYKLYPLKVTGTDIDFAANKDINRFYHLLEINGNVRDRIKRLHTEMMKIRRNVRSAHSGERKVDKDANPGTFMYFVLALLGFSV